MFPSNKISGLKNIVDINKRIIFVEEDRTMDIEFLIVCFLLKRK
ncbi:MAG: hypothetical protein ACTSPW_19025 [Promethearchaeota archaeon]